ncbi:uncharacterized protein LTR77_000086 [Saxophila tyrrhenica]|uniref:Uncharacterized protein n=1 Tax=Saxophila tyrrhenica TaxID=1690608 RepID=A0AAV9PRI9_9PEZI|nr:hypothetical protein LTR77_000086 [Saxophila tyrrhenica]
MATTLFNSLFRRAPQVPPPVKFPYTFKSNPYKAKRPWPPDFSQLSSKHQFRLERRYRRRTKLKWARPGWKKAVTLVQWGSIVAVGIYGVLFLEVTEGRERGVGEGQGERTRGRTVFDGVRKWYWAQMDEFRGTREVNGSQGRQSG